MDWIKQRTFQNWVIGILVALNLLALTVVWIQSGRRDPSPAREPRDSRAMSVPLLQRELGLTPEQVAQYERLRGEQMEKMKLVNDELDSLKLLLADRIFDAPAATAEVDAIAARIGTLQSQLEVLRFRHFSALAQICNGDQKERLRPILREVLGRRGAAGGPSGRPEPAGVRSPGEGGGGGSSVRADKSEPRRERMQGAGAQKEGDDRRPPRSGDRPGPPSLEEKLSRYAERLSLTSEQTRAVEKILRMTREEEETFRSAGRPSEEEFEQEKARLRTREDERIMNLLSGEQRAEFEKMVRNRGAAPPRK